MGLFSWKTADTQESIPVQGSVRFTGKPVYFLQPAHLKVAKPLIEFNYQGYGDFAELDVYQWLARVNIALDDRDAGIGLTHCTLLKVPDSDFYLCNSEALKPFIEGQLGLKVIYYFNWEQPIAEAGGLTPNALRALPDRTGDIEMSQYIKYPLKLSFDPEATYEDCAGSVTCEFQGYFYED
jgi:hypothetical protein